ncbi:MAG: NAD-dependent protein deacylase [Eubacteriales bacterium]|nr:NAD-dependent protein deacylase [Eubacteriales bacterium]
MNEIETFKKWVAESENIVFFGGAGVSTESGIPDFRSKDGLYNQHDVQFDAFTPEYLLSHSCLRDHPNVFYEFYRQKMDCRDIAPNITHKKLADMEEKGKLSAIVTQNIDGLHQKAGSVKVYELHGTTLKNYCTNCGTTYAADYIFENTDPIPKCGCGGTIRPDVVLYEEGLDDATVSGAIRAISAADMIIIGGTSLAVYPAAGLLQYFHGKHMVLINKSATPMDKDADLVLQCGLGEVFSQIEI